MNIDRFIKSKYLKLTVLNVLYFRYYLKTKRFLSKKRKMTNRKKLKRIRL